MCLVSNYYVASLEQIERLAKRLKKENVSVDIVSFGEADANGVKLSAFVDTLNGSKEPKEGKSKWVVLINALPINMCTHPLNIVHVIILYMVIFANTLIIHVHAMNRLYYGLLLYMYVCCLSSSSSVFLIVSIGVILYRHVLVQCYQIY